MKRASSSGHGESWYGAYALLGVVVAGIIPILLPLYVSQSGSAAQLGLVMAALSAGMLSSPHRGELADRGRHHREVFWTGLVIVGMALVLFPLLSGPLAWTALSLLLGCGNAAAATVASLFVVELHPKEEWDARIGSVQTFYGGGQVAGLALAGLFHLNPGSGLWVAAGLMVPALGFALRAPKPSRVPLAARPALPQPDWGVGLPVAGLLSYHHFPDIRQLGRVFGMLRTPFGRFLLAWFLVSLGSAAFFAFYPLLMHEVYGLSANLASWGYAGAAALSLFLYRPAGIWSQKYGAGRVLGFGFGLRLFAFVWLGSLTWLRDARGEDLVILAGFALVVLSWSLLSVAGTALAASLSSLPQGEARGVYNSVMAVAGIGGSVLGGQAGRLWQRSLARGARLGSLAERAAMSWPGAKVVVAQYPSRLKNIVKVLNGNVGMSQFCAHGVQPQFTRRYDYDQPQNVHR